MMTFDNFALSKKVGKKNAMDWQMLQYQYFNFYFINKIEIK